MHFLTEPRYRRHCTMAWGTCGSTGTSGPYSGTGDDGGGPGANDDAVQANIVAVGYGH
jgi:hypothetical protein